MTDQPYDERDDERDAEEAARGQTDREEEGKPYSGDSPDSDTPETHPLPGL